MNLFFKYYKEKATRKRRRGIATSSGYICFLSWNKGGVGGLKNVTHRNLNDTRKKGRQPTGRGVNNFVCFSNAPELSNKSLLFTLQLFPTPSIFFLFSSSKKFFVVVVSLLVHDYGFKNKKFKSLNDDRWFLVSLTVDLHIAVQLVAAHLPRTFLYCYKKRNRQKKVQG